MTERQEPERIQAYNKWWVESSAYDALLAERDALKEKAERLHDALQGVAARPFVFCLVCHCGVEHHVPDCPAAPDFLQKAREGR